MASSVVRRKKSQDKNNGFYRNQSINNFIRPFQKYVTRADLDNY